MKKFFKSEMLPVGSPQPGIQPSGTDSYNDLVPSAGSCSNLNLEIPLSIKTEPTEDTDPHQDEDFDSKCELVLGKCEVLDCELPKVQFETVYVKCEHPDPCDADASYYAEYEYGCGSNSQGGVGFDQSCEEKVRSEREKSNIKVQEAEEPKPLITVTDGQKTYFCPTCPYKTADCSNIKRHIIRVHNKAEKTFKCDLCEYSTTQKSNLRRHMLTHSGLKPFKCTLCCYCCTTVSKLKKHMCRHTGEKKYECTLCTYGCVTPGDLKRHMSAHTGHDKPHKCPRCSVACSRPSELKIHLFTHTGHKPHKCSECSFASGRLGDLKVHLFTHNGYKPFSCAHCHYKAARKTHLVKHLTCRHR